MLILFADAVWRAAALVALGIAPFAAPVDVSHGHGAWAVVRALVALALFVGVERVCVRVRTQDAWPARLAAVLFAATALMAILLAGDRGPLARGAFVATPLVWLLVASLAVDPYARVTGRPVRAVRAAAFGAALVVAAALLFASRPRLTPAVRAWEVALAADPGNEAAAIAVARARWDAGDHAAALATSKACARAEATNCRCAEVAAGEAIDVGAYLDARALLDASAACPASSGRGGTMAEALVGTQQLDAGLAQAIVVIDHEPMEAHALFARAWALDLRGDPSARVWAQRAVDAGRGAPAQMLLGSILFRTGDLDGAKRAFDVAVAASPGDARAAYDLALVAQKQGHYHDAREGYLRALHADPTMLDARYNLAMLAHSHGADAEALHHAEEFTRAAPPGDPRVASLKQALATPP